MEQEKFLLFFLYAESNLFITTANPATLMAIENGAGSAVMGPGGIVAQISFVAAGATVCATVAPLLAMTAIASISSMQQFSIVNEKLDRIYEEILTILIDKRQNILAL